MLKFYVKVYYVMDKGCQASYPVPVTGLVIKPCMFITRDISLGKNDD